MAICNGSVSPSRSTNTGAFILDSTGQPQGSQRISKNPRTIASLHIIPSSSTSDSTLTPPTSNKQTYLICNALVPNTRARSYFVIYGVVDLFSVGTFLSFNPATAFFLTCCCGPPSPLTSTTVLPPCTPFVAGTCASGSSVPPGAPGVWAAPS